MADCSGYGFGVEITLCVDGAVGNGNKANLTLSFTNLARSTFTQSQSIIVNNWDGKEIVVDVTPALGFAGLTDANCTDISANVTITPTRNNQGTMLVEITLDNCAQATQSFYPQVFENCGGTGPHTISEMSSFTLNGLACPV